jgi:hypothetical protein
MFPNINLLFRLLVSLGSFQVFGISTDLKQFESSNNSRPILIQPTSSNNQLNQPKLLQVEFEINPLNKDSGYRIQVISQSVEIIYNAVRIQIIKQLITTDLF